MPAIRMGRPCARLGRMPRHHCLASRRKFNAGVLRLRPSMAPPAPLQPRDQSARKSRPRPAPPMLTRQSSPPLRWLPPQNKTQARLAQCPRPGQHRRLGQGGARCPLRRPALRALRADVPSAPLSHPSSFCIRRRNGRASGSAHRRVSCRTKTARQKARRLAYLWMPAYLWTPSYLWSALAAAVRRRRGPTSPSVPPLPWLFLAATGSRSASRRS
mmetsp:Transcript_29644/g.94307  ORF Transcript_29644/g.94307 Transcript_29644/m.94307 type:complete len:215 (+) Transcript_29644:721-1365(+)